jgi:polyhydroxyalkanoate synthesis regulator phasin
MKRTKKNIGSLRVGEFFPSGEQVEELCDQLVEKGTETAVNVGGIL